MPPINYLAVVVSAVTVFVIGMLWYTALFGRQWVAAHGYTPEQLETMKRGMGRAYAVSFVCYLVMGVVMAVLIGRMNIAGVLGGVKIGGATWLGFVATIGLTANLYSNKSFAAYVIDAGYQLVFMLVMGVILAVWR